MNLLQLNNSIFGDNGNSSQLTRQWVSAWQQHHPDGTVTVRDLGTNPLPHIDAATMQAFATPAGERTVEQQQVVDLSDALIEELRQADAIVIGLPLYNLGTPSSLKAYFDHIARAGVTFRYTENGPEGLLGGKPVTVLAARGGVYAGTDADVQTSYIKLFLGFIGLTDVDFIYAEGLNMGEDSKASAMKNASEEISRRVA